MTLSLSSFFCSCVPFFSFSVLEVSSLVLKSFNVFQESLKFKGSFNNVSKKFLGCLQKISRVNFKEVLRVFQGSFKSVSRKFQGIFKGVSTKISWHVK